jgi:hypothetical protein
MQVSIYTRRKNEAGRWRYERVSIGPGRRPANLKGPFYPRYTAEDGSQPFKVIPDCETLDDAIKAAESLGHALLAKSKGLTVPELDASANGLQKLGVCSL